jgi:hypothetical protein
MAKDPDLHETLHRLEKLHQRWKDPAAKAADMKRAAEDFARGEMLPDPIRSRCVCKPWP